MVSTDENDPSDHRKLTSGHFASSKIDRGSLYEGGHYSSLHRTTDRWVLYQLDWSFTSRVKASAHSFKQFTSRLLKSTFSLSLCTYITQMDVMLDFICMGPVDLQGARQKRQNTK